jgi:glycosyltransferase involved in cell wall biosynthesis
MIETNKPLVSVIIPCYKMGRFLGDALTSVGAQSYPHWEVLAVDDAGPEDGTRDIVSTFAKAHASHRIELIRHETNQGVSAARNTALRAARGEYVAFLDPDDIWTPGHLEFHLSGFQADPQMGLSASPAWIFTKTPDPRSDEIEFFTDWERDMFPYALGLRCGFAMSAIVVRRSSAGVNLVFVEAPELQHIED